MKRTRSNASDEPAQVKPDLSWLDEYHITNAKQRAFLTALSVTGNPYRAAEASGTSRKSHYQWLGLEGEAANNYREATEDAKKRACEFLENEAWERAVNGIKVAKWHNGKRVGHDIHKSDLLLIFMMKGAMPDKYRDNVTLKGNLDTKLTLEQIVAAANKPDDKKKEGDAA